MSFLWAVKAWRWVTKNTEAVVVMLVSVLGLGLFYSYHKRKVGKVKDLLAVEQAQKEISALRAERRVLSEMGTAMKSDLDEVDKRIQARKRRIVSAHKDVEGLSDGEVVELFADLGY